MATSWLLLCDGSLSQARTYCYVFDIWAEDESAVAAAHDKIGLRYDSITQVNRVSGMDLR